MATLCRWLLPFVALLLAACEQVRFAELPGDAQLACEPAWVGDWSVEELGSGAPAPEERNVLRVEADCAAFHLLALKEGRWVREDHLPNDDYRPRFSRTAKHRLLGLLPVEGESTALDPKVLIWAWTSDGSTIEIALPDVRGSAELLVGSSAYAGTVIRSRQGGTAHVLNVHFTGERDALTRLLDQEDLFDPPGLRLTPIPPQERTRLDPLLRAAIAADQRKQDE